MAWAAIIIAVVAAVYAYSRIPKPQIAPPPSLDDLEAPTAEEGRSIPVLFGRRRIKSPNVVWYGDLNTTPVRQKVKGLLGSKYQNTGQYKVYLGMHMIIGVGPFDSIDKIEVGDKIAWEGYTTGGQISINNNNLFGGDKKQGGIVGSVDIEMGLQSQVQNDYLLSVLGEDIPAYRGVVGVVLRHVYLGTTNFIKPWAFWGSRIHTRSDGTSQWYDEKSEIIVAVGEASVQYVNISAVDLAGPSSGVTINVNGPGSLITITKPSVIDDPQMLWDGLSYWAADDAVTPVVPPVVGQTWSNGFSVQSDGVDIYAAPVSNLFHATEAEALEELQGIVPITLSGYSNYTLYGYDPNPPDNRGGLSLKVSVQDTYGDMNPAHIIREALTDRKFALRYSGSQINDSSFIASADTLYDEGMGMSLYWTGENSIEEFIGEVLRHIDGNCYVDKRTGQWVMPLIRDDYDVESLPVLNESNVVSVSNYKQPTISELTNSVTVVYWDAVTGSDASVTVRDPVLVDLQGGIVNETIQYPGFTNHDVASRAALRDLRAKSSPMISCTIRCDRTAADLNIGDPFLFFWPDLKINGVVMRVDSINLGDIEKAEIIIDCVQDVFASVSAVGAGVVASPDSGLWVDPTSGTPQEANPRVVIEAPYYMVLESVGQADADAAIASDPGFGMLLVAAGRQGSEINADLFVQSDAEYQEASELSFTAWAEIENISRYTTKIYVLGVAKDLSRMVVPALSVVRDEFVVVDSVGEDSGGVFFNARRGALDTIPKEHETDSSGTLHLVAINQYSESDEVPYSVGDTAVVKVVTNQQSASLSIDDAPTDDVEFASRAVRPYPPGNVKLNGEYWPAEISGDLEISARHRNRLTQVGVDIVDFYDDTDYAAEAGQTYSYELYDAQTETLIDSDSSILVFPINIPATSLVVQNRLELFSERDGYESARLIFNFESAFEIFYNPIGGAVDETYSNTFSAPDAESPIVWSIISGSLPTGWSLNSSTGELSGVATTSGYYTFEVQAEDSASRIRVVEVTLGVADIVSLNHFNGSDEATSTTDEAGISWTFNGNAKLDNAQARFGATSLFCDGTGDYLTATNAALNLNSVDFTIMGSAYYNSASYSADRALYSNYLDNGSGRFVVYASSSGQLIVVEQDGGAANTVSISSSASAVPRQQWFDWAVTKQGTTIRAFINGALVLSGTSAVRSSYVGNGSIGRFADTTFQWSWLGWIDEVSVKKNAAVFLAAYTPVGGESDFPA